MEILIIFILTLLNGFFALSEIALVSVKKSSIEHLAAQGSTRARSVLKLLENPENFLSSVQVGITLIGIVSGAYGGAALTDDMESLLSPLNLDEDYSRIFSLVTVIGSITYFTIVIGELVPKTFAMNNAERISLVCVPVIKYFTLLTYPFVKLLSVSTNLILRLFGIKGNRSEKVSEEELRFILKTAGKQGVLEKEESEVHYNLFSFTDQTAKSLMTHRTEVEWVNINDSILKISENLKQSVHTKFVVGDAFIDKILGVITIKDFLANYRQPNFSINRIISPPVYINQNVTAFEILNKFKDKKQYIGVVVDESGSTKGIITLRDLTEALVGDLPESPEMNIIKRDDNNFLIDGRTLIYELNQYFHSEIIESNISQYTTISGFVLAKIQKIPTSGEKIRHEKYEFKIMDMDGNRIDKVMMTIKF